MSHPDPFVKNGLLHTSFGESLGNHREQIGAPERFGLTCCPGRTSMESSRRGPGLNYRVRCMITELCVDDLRGIILDKMASWASCVFTRLERVPNI